MGNALAADANAFCPTAHHEGGGEFDLPFLKRAISGEVVRIERGFWGQQILSQARV